MVLFMVLFLIAVRRIGGINLRIWQIMLFGALAVLLTGQITPADALNSINPDVMLFLFCMFVVGQALEESGYLSHLSYRFFRRAKSVDALVLSILLVVGISSAFLMNDTLAIIGTPVVLLLAKKHNMSPHILLLSLCFAVTIGSVMSPIGNPQNLLIAINGGMKNPFVDFFFFLLIPTIINLFLAYFVLKFFYSEHFHDNPLIHDEEPIIDPGLASVCRFSLILIVLLVAVKVSIIFLGVAIDLKLTYIALVGASPVLVLSPRRLKIAMNIDWHILIFFAAMFVLMESVWDSGFFQGFLDDAAFNPTSNGVIIVISILLSQLISNVPLVMLYLPLLLHAGVSKTGLIALAAGSTIAGNLTILGAASNVIVIQNAEKKAGETISFMEFFRVGLPLTLINFAVYWFFLEFV